MIYLVRDDIYVKVGYVKDSESRRGNLQTGNPRELLLWAAFPGEYEIESAIHQYFRHIGAHVRGEWFLINDEILSLVEGWLRDGEICLEAIKVPPRVRKGPKTPTPKSFYGVEGVRCIGIRELRANLASELDDLPINITRNGVVVAIVSEPDDYYSETIRGSEERDVESVSVYPPAMASFRASEVWGTLNPYSKSQQVGKERK